MKTYPAPSGRARHLCAVVLLAAVAGAGCATRPYRYGVAYVDPKLPETPPEEPQIVRGRPHRLLDASDWIWPGSWLGKAILWDRRVDSHHIGEETEAVLRRYMDANGLHFVKARLNAYHVRDEWRRLRTNRSVGAGWRYSLGVLSWLHYTLLPGRFFGGDHYNPYTDSIHLYSDIPAIAVHEGGHAKDFAGRKWKGAYAALYLIPFANLYHEALATNDALGYLVAEEDLALQREGYRILYPAYGTYVGGNVGGLVPAWDVWLYGGSVVGGHILGRVVAPRAETVSPLPGHDGE